MPPSESLFYFACAGRSLSILTEMFDTPEDAVLQLLTCQGANRCLNLRKTGTSVVWPQDPPAGWKQTLREEQLRVFGHAERENLMMEMLCRSQAMVEFWDANVGGTSEYPLALQGESAAALDALDDILNRVRSLVGLLTEL